MQVNFWTHACAEIIASGKRIITDPWCIGPAFLGGWWLKHKPPSDWLERLTTADAIYISHTHSDHMNPTTLLKLANERLDAPIYVPDYESKSAEKTIARYGFTNVKVVPFRQVVDMGDGVSFQILPDASGRDDSGLVVNDNGKYLVNVVDAPNLNQGILPTGIEWLLAPFASGGSGYPLCYEEQYDDIPERLGNLRNVAMKSLLRLVNITEPKNLMPFAGYYVHHGLRDQELGELNKKNTAQMVWNSYRWTHPHIKVHLPTSELETHWDWTAAVKKPQFVDLQEYFDWAGYRGDMTLVIEETDNYLRSVLSRHFVNFETGEVTRTEPHTHGRLMRMRVRKLEFHYALANGLGWEELSTGFHCRFWRLPDRYEVDFWDHFQNRLPAEALHARLV